MRLCHVRAGGGAVSLLSRTKGVSFERGIAVTLRTIWKGAKRGIGQARAAGECPDVEGTPYWIEAKHRKRVSIGKAYAQALKDSDGRAPLVITRENRGPILVTMGLVEWMDAVDTTYSRGEGQRPRCLNPECGSRVFLIGDDGDLRCPACFWSQRMVVMTRMVFEDRYTERQL